MLIIQKLNVQQENIQQQARKAAQNVQTDITAQPVLQAAASAQANGQIAQLAQIADVALVNQDIL